MRIDKYLKVSRIIKRRTVAADCCSGGKVNINGKSAKSGDRVKVGDIVEISMGPTKIKIEVLATPEHASKDDAQNIYRVI